MPLAILNDGDGRGDPWRRPTFLPGTEEPELERGENLLVRIVECAILLETRAAPGEEWQEVWRTRRPGQATVTDRRIVVGSRRYDAGSGRTVLCAIAWATGYRRGGRCLGGHFRYEWVSDLAVTLGQPREVSYLRMVASEPWLRSEVRALPDVHGDGGAWISREQSRQWRLSVGSAGATSYLPDLAGLVAAEVAEAHRRGAGPEGDLTAIELDLAAAEGWPALRPGPGETGAVHVPGACPLGTRPIGADERAWRA